MLIKGKLDGLSTLQALNLINLAQKTGTLSIHRINNEITDSSNVSNTMLADTHGELTEIYFGDGWVISANQPGKNRNFLDTLYKNGRLNSRQLQSFYKYPREKSERRLALTLINRKYVSKSDVIEAVQARTLEIMIDIMTWRMRQLEFSETIPDLSDRILAPINPKDIIAIATRFFYQRQQLEEVLPDMDITLRFVENPVDKFEDVELTADEWRVVGFINTNKTIQEIALSCNFTDTEVRRIVQSMRTMGIIELEVPPNTLSENDSFPRELFRKLETQALQILKVLPNSKDKQRDDQYSQNKADKWKEAHKVIFSDLDKLIDDEAESQQDLSTFIKAALSKKSAHALDEDAVEPETEPEYALDEETIPQRENSAIIAEFRTESEHALDEEVVEPRTEPEYAPDEEVVEPRTEPEYAPDEETIPQQEESAENPTVLAEASQITANLFATTNMQICPRCYHRQSKEISICEECELQLGSNTLKMQTLPMLTLTDIELDVAEIRRGTITFPFDGWLILDFGKEQLTLPVTERLILGRIISDEQTEIVDLSPFNGRKKGVSKKHVAIELGVDGILVITDLGTFNGTVLNNKRLSPFTQYRLYDGDKLRLGNLEININFLSKFGKNSTENME